MVHQDVGFTAPDGHTCVVDHVHFASHTDAVLEPRYSARRAARKLLRDSCERLPFATSTVHDAAVVFGELVAMSVALSRNPVTVRVDADGRIVTVRVTTPPSAGAVFSPAHPPSWLHSREIVQSLASSWDYRIDETGAELTAEIRAHRVAD
jgi:hypothetical protein